MTDDIWSLHFQFWAYDRLPCLRLITTLGLETYPRGWRWHHSTLTEVPIAEGFTYSLLQLKLLTTDVITWVPYSEDHLTVGFKGGFPTRAEYLLSTRRIPLLTDGGWELYLEKRAIKSITGVIRVPFSLPARRYWSLYLS